MKKHNRKLKGFTLVELIVVVAVFGVLLAAALALMEPLTNVYKDTYQYSDAQTIIDNTRRVVEDNLRFADRMRVVTNVGLKSTYTDKQFARDYSKKISDMFILNNSDPHKKRQTYGTDEVYCMKIDNPESLTDLDDKGGQISVWKYTGGTMDPSSKDWAVNEEFYNDYSITLTFRNTLAVSDNGNTIRYLGKTKSLLNAVYTTPSIVSPSNFSFDLNIYTNEYQDRANLATSKIDLCRTNVSSIVALSLINMTQSAALFNETVKWVDPTITPPTENSSTVTRFGYTDDPTTLGISDVIKDTSSADIYIFYTKTRLS